MAETSRIEWTHSTLNPITGCTHISEGCRNCYAERMARRQYHMKTKGYEEATKPGGGWTGTINYKPAELKKLYEWKKPRQVFLCSMADMFHKDVKPEWLNDIFYTMAENPRHTYQILTKRANIMYGFVTRWIKENGPLSPNVWLGVSAENQAAYDLRVPALCEIPAAVRWVSFEPLLGTIDLRPKDPLGVRCLSVPAFDWGVIGAETGPGARELDAPSMAGLAAQLIHLGKAVFVKQLSPKLYPKTYKDFESFPPNLQIRQWPQPKPERLA